MEVFIGFENKPRLFSRPQSVIRCDDSAGLAGAFSDIERAVSQGFYVAGFLSYEAGYCFEKRLDRSHRYDFPLLLMGIYKKPRPVPPPAAAPGAYSVGGLGLNISKETYFSHIAAIREHIARGDVYQITYCIKFRFSFKGDDRSLYADLLRRQPVPYPAYIKTDAFSVLSLSPERFMRKTSAMVLTEPMKGTWPRGGTVWSDLAGRWQLRSDSKNRAENLMIADLLRNDLGRIGNNIRWPRLFTVAAYRTLFQMTSTITGEVPRRIPIYDLFAALFPSGSVTGTPKIRAMEIIRELETEERRIYTGAIGYISPDRDLYFNIPIRTLLLNGEAGEMGIGGGIVWDSTPQGEWDEAMLKSRFLTGLFPVRGKVFGVSAF
jgi:para-aminobenzoate synthetase / 4-amino-4-deoxychorismate lyase